jgi:hypothetical protein
MSGRTQASRDEGGSPPAWQERPAVAYSFVSVLAILLIFRGGLGPISLHNDLSIYWVWADQFTAGLARGNFYPRWMPESDAGLGTPVFYFYPPLAFYLTAALSFAGLSTYASLIAVFGIGFAGSGIACWHWLKGRSNHPLLAAAFFMAAPYHIFNYTDRRALAESLAIALIPIIAIGLRRISEGRGGVVATAIAYTAIIATHLPLALLVSVFLIAPYALAHRSHIAQFAVAVAGGISAAAIYLVPAILLQPHRDAAQLYRTPLLRTDFWSLFSGNWSETTFTVTFLIIAAIVVAAAWPALRRRDGWARYSIAVAIVTAGLIPYFWSLPLLQQIQFPFRALPIAEFGLATALARLPRDPGLRLAPSALPLALSLIVLPGFHPGADDVRHLRAFHPDAYEYLPRGVMQPGQTSARLSDVLAPRVPPPQVPGMVVEPHFYFPAWSCGTMEPRTQLLIHLPDCSPRIVWTKWEKLGAAVSLLTAIMLAFIASTGRRISASPLVGPSKVPIRVLRGLLGPRHIPEGEPAIEQRASDSARRAA